MARTVSNKIYTHDLEYVIEYLLVYTVSRRAYSNDSDLTRGRNRVKLLQAALTLERAMLELRDLEYLDAVDHVCIDVEGIMFATLKPSEIRKLRTAIRQKRYKNDGYSRVAYEYANTKEFLAKKGGSSTVEIN